MTHCDSEGSHQMNSSKASESSVVMLSYVMLSRVLSGVRFERQLPYPLNLPYQYHAGCELTEINFLRLNVLEDEFGINRTRQFSLK